MERIWWEQITNANRFVSLIVNSILEEKSSVLALSQLTPWRNTMRELVEHRVLSEKSDTSLDLLDSPQNDVGGFMLHKYCKADKRLSYRPNKSYAQFLAESDDIVLNSRIVWIQNISAKIFWEWVKFVSEYHLSMRRDISPAVFILEMNDDFMGKNAKKSVNNIVYEKEMNYFDTYAFCILAASGLSSQTYLKNYWAELLSNLCGIDIELSTKCLEKTNNFLENPYQVLTDIVEKERRSDGTLFSFSLDEDYLTKRVWKTQIKIVFPIIEDYREIFVNKYREQITKLLPIKSSHGEDCTEAEEVEIGTLNYMVATGQLMVDQNTHDELYKFKEARNTLAHVKPLSLAIVTDILGCYSVSLVKT